jgi:hypothetical protein
MEFPPGHRIRIVNFVKEVKERLEASQKKSRKKMHLGHSPSKRHLASQQTTLPREKGKPSKKLNTGTSSSETEIVDTSDAMAQLVKSIDQWKSKQSEGHLQNLQVDVHYTIEFAHDEEAQVVKIRCIPCNSLVVLHRIDRTDINIHFKLSNWTRHVKKCSMIKLSGSQQKQKTLWQHWTSMNKPQVHHSTPMSLTMNRNTDIQGIYGAQSNSTQPAPLSATETKSSGHI